MSREAKIVLAVCAAVTVAAVALAADRRPRPMDRSVVYARVQQGPGVTQYLPVSGNAAGTCAPVFSNGELTQIRSFGKNGEQIIYTVSPGQEGRFLYVRSLGPNGTLVYEPASLNPKPSQPDGNAAQPAGSAQPVAVPQPQIPFSDKPPAATPGGKPPASVAVQVEAPGTGRLAREWAEVFSALTGSTANATAEEKSR